MMNPEPEQRTSLQRVGAVDVASRPGVLVAPQNPPANGQESGAGPRFVLHVLRRRWKVALPIGIVLAIAAATVVVLLFVPQYEAQALLEIADQPQYIAFEPRHGERSKAYFLTQMQLIQSNWILGRVVAQPAIAAMPEIRKQADPIAWLTRQVHVSALAESDAFTISYASPDPGNAATLVNEVASQYLKARRDTEAARNKDIIRALTRELGVRHEAVAALRSQIGALARQLTAKDLPVSVAESSGGGRHPLSELQGRLIALQLERAMIGARIKALEEQADSAAATKATRDASPGAPGSLSDDERLLRDMFIERAISENTTVKLATERLSEKQAMLDAIEGVAAQGKRSAAYQRKQAELRVDEEALEKLKTGLRGRLAKEAELATSERRRELEATALAKRRDELVQLRCLERGYQIAEENLASEYASFQKEAEKASSDNLDLLFKKDELSQSQMVLYRITARQFELQTEQGAPPRVIWHQEATAPQSPIQEFPYRNAGLAFLIGLCVPFGAAAAWERYLRRIGDSDSLRQQSSLTILGETTRLPTRVRSPRVRGDSIRGELEMFEESVDSLRTALILSSGMRDVRVLAVTSASKDEGKTSVAAQLAISLAKATGSRILLIDGDLRSPDVHRVFDVPLEPGLADVLANECPIDEAIVAAAGDDVAQVCVMPAGRPKASPHQLLGNGSWKALVERIPDAYRYVIVDTPPVLAAAEALVLARGADASLMCVMRDVSRADQVQKATERLAAAGGYVVGAVLNGVPTRQYAYRYGRYSQSSEPSSDR